ncbi:MAG: DUF2878 domain-containing protein [Lysobacteraceae bacterium]
MSQLGTWLPNALGFQFVWCATVGGAARGLWWPGLLALAAFAGWQLRISRHRRADLQLMLVAAIGGFALDSLWVGLGWVQHRAALPWSPVAPVWIVALWIGFALTLNHSLAALKPHRLLAIAFGALGGPLAYWIAAELWQASTIDGWIPYLALALAWGVATPLLLCLASRLTADPPSPTHAG